MTIYYRPIARCDAPRPPDARPVAGGWTWFDRVECMQRGQVASVVSANEVPPEVLDRISRPRDPIAGLEFDRAHIMGIVNVTPDSFSDGGQFGDATSAVDAALGQARDGATILDIGGESTRPGAAEVPVDEEIARVEPVIRGIRETWDGAISIDTRKAAVARVSIAAGATLINDVSALSFDVELAEIVAKNELPVCLMHAQGDPETMQKNPEYDDVLLDVFDYLQARIQAAEAIGIPRSRIVVDPGIGFGKTVEHNLALLRGISLFHCLGCVILLGASRKRFLGTLTGAEEPAQRLPATIAVTLAAMRHGVQIHRIHDVLQVRQAMMMWQEMLDNGQKT